MHNKMHNLQQAKINNMTEQLLQGAQIRFLGAHNGDWNRHCAEHTTNCCQRWIRSEWFGLLTLLYLQQKFRHYLLQAWRFLRGAR